VGADVSEQLMRARRQQADPMPVEPKKGLLKAGYARRYAQWQADVAAWRRRHAGEQIRQTVHGRPISIVVMNQKGGSGKTPTIHCLAAAIGQQRPGQVAAWEATDEKGNLLDYAEGRAAEGVVELIEAAARGQIKDSAALTRYGLTQSSGVTVYGTVGSRKPFTDTDVETLYEVLSKQYPVSVIDSANTTRTRAITAVLDLADAVVVPTTVDMMAIKGALDTLRAVLDEDPHHIIRFRPELRQRTVVILSHHRDVSRMDENERRTYDELHAMTLDVLSKLPTPIPVIEVPYDQHIADKGPITQSSLSEASRDAWQQAAATVLSLIPPTK